MFELSIKVHVDSMFSISFLLAKFRTRLRHLIIHSECSRTLIIKAFICLQKLATRQTCKNCFTSVIKGSEYSGKAIEFACNAIHSANKSNSQLIMASFDAVSRS
ncbi:unnamed protein product [Schistosoma mattheei]|uniref:Uncharacterized protein n=1 Tax=Schistosoma mattheei TaxID=31246 RepID=A0A3P8CMQ9_9TREM|nr:unnamed protein product [Schistosoma mattheei]